MITSVPGSSQYFAGSVVAYSNAVKKEWLGVTKKMLSIHGAVSRPVVEQMVRGPWKNFPPLMPWLLQALPGQREAHPPNPQEPYGLL